MRWMVGVLELFCSSDELLAEAPKTAEIGAARDLVDRADDVADGIDGVGYHDAASGIGESVVAPIDEALPCAGAGVS